MSTPTSRTEEERGAWWATLAPDALEDEIRVNLRAERRLVPIALVAGALTVVILLLRAFLA
ncbi:hypothetical protein ACFO3K_11615 [Cellulomonas algicola]|uniref:hypothetical protein n=1 Tax=Cellulomonas algicola TaxID=2071633 RepID=UPI001C3FB0C3|nr:hypothetical protein [Cellulomonas algicola]